jgi:hypothetical protein
MMQLLRVVWRIMCGVGSPLDPSVPPSAVVQLVCKENECGPPLTHPVMQ